MLSFRIRKSVWPACLIAILVFGWQNVGSLGDENSRSADFSQPAGIVEGFESLEPTWNLHAPRGRTKLIHHSRSRRDKHSGLQSEWIRIQSSGSSQVRLVHPIKRSQLIRDFCPGIWIKSNRTGVRFNARIVLPATRSPNGDGPLLLQVPVGEVTRANVWEKIEASDGDVMKRLDERLRSVKLEHPDLRVSRDDAYCDLVTFDRFAQATSQYELFVDDLSVKGHLPPPGSALGLVPNGASNPAVGGPASLTQVSVGNSTWNVNDTPVFLRAIQYHGESFVFLKRLGMNAIILPRPPTPDQLKQARQYQIWILCPPPDDLESFSRQEDSGMVFAWNLGDSLTSSDLPRVDTRAEQMAKLAAYEGRRVLSRPTFCHAYYPLSRFLSMVDFVRLDLSATNRETIISPTGGPPTQIGLNSPAAKKLVGVKPFLANIQCDYSASRKQQVSLWRKKALGELTVEAIRCQVYAAIEQGARGVVFQKRTPLEPLSATPGANTSNAGGLANSLQEVNFELRQMEPWISGGKPQSIDSVNFHTTRLILDRSELVLAWPRPPKGRRQRKRRVEIPCRQISGRAFKITSTGIVPAIYSRRNGCLQLDVGSGHGVQRLVIADGPMPFQFVQQTTSSFTDTGLLTARVTSTKSASRQTHAVLESLGELGFRDPQIFIEINSVRKKLASIDSMIKQKHFATVEGLLDEVDRSLSAIRNSLSDSIDRQVSSNNAFGGCFQLLADRLALELAIRQSRFSPNRLSSGTFQSLGKLAAAGWTQHLNEVGGVEARINIEPIDKDKDEDKDEDRTGGTAATGFGVLDGNETQTETASGRSLVISTRRRSPAGSGIPEVTPVWITTPSVAVGEKKLVRIEGHIRIDEPIEGSHDGLMIIDSIGGVDLAFRCQKTSGWESFAIDRLVSGDTQMQIIFAMTGLGEAKLADIKIRSIDLNHHRGGGLPFALRPANGLQSNGAVGRTIVGQRTVDHIR